MQKSRDFSISALRWKTGLSGVGDHEVFELPRIFRVEIRLVVAFENIGVMLQRRPVIRLGNPRAEIRLGDLQNVFVWQFVRHHDALVRIFNHPHHGADHGDRHLHRRRILMRHEPAGFLDAQVTANPPGIITVTHQQRA